MSARGHGPPAYGSRSTHSSYTIEPQHPDHQDSKLVARSAEIERLASDKQRLSATHIALSQDLVATQQDIQKIRAHIGSVQTESDIQIRILLDKMAKMEAQIRAGENVKKDLQKAHTEARALVATRQELNDQVKKATQELDKVRADVEKLPEMKVELDGLRQEHQKLRSTFEHEKGKNMEKVAQMELMEKDLVGMAREVERLRAEVLNAEKRANAPTVYGAPYMNQELYPPPPHMHANGPGYGNHHVQMGIVGAGEGMNPYGGPHPGPAAPGTNPQWGPPPMIPYGGHPQWGGPSPYDNSYSRT